MKPSIYCHTFAYLLLVAIIFFGCEEQNKTKQRKCHLIVRNGSGWSAGGSIVECDSCKILGENNNVLIELEGTNLNGFTLSQYLIEYIGK